MASSDDYASIADASKPNAGRIYDYILGGTHNFEVDRKAAEQLLQLAPILPQMFRLVRWFLGEATRRLLGIGFDKFVDFASGLPTQDHIHEVAPAGTKVIYSDIDPVTVTYAQEIIKDNPHTIYIHCDAAKPEKLLNSNEVQELFGDDKKVVFGFNGIAYFLTDDQIANTMQLLYEWAVEGSRLFLTDLDMEVASETSKKFFETYKNMGQPVSVRGKTKLIDLIKPWKVCEPGPLTLEKWIDLPNSKISELQIEVMGGDLYGLIVAK